MYGAALGMMGGGGFTGGSSSAESSANSRFDSAFTVNKGIKSEHLVIAAVVLAVVALVAFRK